MEKNTENILSLIAKTTTMEKRFSSEGKNTIVLFADMEKSTHYKATHTIFEGLRKVITHNTTINDVVKKRKGDVIKWLGDGVMASFDESEYLDSVLASIEIQNFFKEYNTDKSIEDKINCKIGLSIGQCVEIPKSSISTKDIMGLPVDKAARIQSLAKPGQILVDYDLRKKIIKYFKKNDVTKKNKDIVFSSPKFRNLRGIGKVKVSEIKSGPKFLGIDNEENDLSSVQLESLADILTNNHINNISDKLSLQKKQSQHYKFLVDDEEKHQLVRNMIDESKESIRILSYSFSSWKDRVEVPILNALKRGVKVDILVLSGSSKHRFEKTLYESFRESISTKDWMNKVQNIQKSYHTSLQSTLDKIQIWKNELDSDHKELLNIKSYEELPIMYGFMFDGKNLSFTSPYIDLVETGYNLPAIYISEGKGILENILIKTFQTWFDLNFVTGKNLSENYI
jgi:class 3 adenylate cyclase